jgi:hypothetical protein
VDLAQEIVQQNHAGDVRRRTRLMVGVSSKKQVMTERVLFIPEIRSLHCSDLDYGASPDDPTDCALYIEAEIGAKGREGADIFGFTAITPKAISADQETRWGRGYLILRYFSWDDIE